MFVADPLSARVHYVSANALHVLGATPEEITGSPEWWPSHVHPDDYPRVLEAYRSAVAQRAEQVRTELRLRRDEGEIWLDCVGQMEYDAAGAPVRVLGYCTDVSRHKATEEALRAAEERYRTIFEQAPVGIYQASVDGSFISVNPAVARITGYSSAEELLRAGAPVSDYYLNPSDRNPFVEMIESRGGVSGFETRIRRRDGEVRWISLDARAVRDDAGQMTGIEAIAIDITDRRRAQRRERTQLAVTRALAESVTLRDAAARLPRTICEGFGWDLGEIWLALPGADRLRWVAAWHRPEMDVSVFIEQSRTQSLGRGEGVAGRTWVTGEPSWCADIATDEGNPRSEAAAHAGLHAAFAIPVRRGGAVLAVMSFLSRHVQQQDAELLTTMADIGMQISQFVERLLLETRLRTSEQRLTRIIETMADGIVLMDAEGRYSVTNAAAEQIVGVRREQFLGLRPWEVPWRRLTLDGAPMPEAAHPFDLTLAADGPVRDMRFIIERPDGSRVTVAVNTAPFYDAEGALAGVIATFHDITELQAAQTAALEGSRAKSEFLSRMSHELRTPLNAILGFAQLMELEETTADQTESIAQILSAGRHLLDLINEVLDITRIESGGLTLSIEPVHLGETLLEVIDLVRPLAQQSDVRVQTSLPPGCDAYVLADRQRLKQVLLNLLMNAVKYNRAHGSATFLRTVTADSVPGLRLAVRDTGYGISDEGLARLFTPFERLGAEQRGIEGTGLGLSLSLRLMEAMGGRIGVESRVGEGSSFWIELPQVSTPAEEAPVPRPPVLDAAAAPAGAPARTILYIEDNLSNYRLIERALAIWPGLRLISSIQGGLGVELAREHRPDLILLDVHLPDISGEEVLRRLQRDAATRDIPVLAISADATAGRIERLLAAGASDYLTKPLDLGRFIAMVDELLDWERSERAP